MKEIRFSFDRIYDEIAIEDGEDTNNSCSILDGKRIVECRRDGADVILVIE